MNLRQSNSACSRASAAASLALALLMASAIASAQAPAPPPPAPPTPPAATPAPSAPADAAAPVPASSGIDPVKEREIIDFIVNGKKSVQALDLATAQMYFEQAFAKCDEYQVKGPLLARVYMALGSLFAGFLQQIPQGTEFMKMALQNDPTVRPEAELTNETVTTTYEMVCERLGITGPAKVDTGGGAPAMGPGGFWVMKHERITQAKRMYPFGVYVDSNPMVAIQGVRFYFRLPSDRNYQMADMQKNGAMYGILIGCDAIALLDPQAIYYYIEVVGGDGSIIANEGTIDSPIEIKMIDEAAFSGVQPNLPGMPDQEKCNPDDAAPCPPWDPHCHDIPCVTTEDCLGSKVCSGGYCVSGEGGEIEEESDIGAIGLSIWGGIGMGFGVVGGKPAEVYDSMNVLHEIDLASGLSPSWMYERLGIGYFITDWIRAGVFLRLQNINSQSMKIAGPANEEYNNFPMFGITGTVFYWGNGKWFDQGQVVTEEGKLADEQGLRLYARIEFDIYGAMYHQIKLSYKDPTGEDVYTKQQRASGMQAIGLGPGLLYGLHKYVDVGIEVMYDYVGLGTETWAHNFDVWAQLHLHF